MPTPNITQTTPEIPNADSAPKSVTNTPVPQNPMMPAILTSRMAKDQAKKDLKELSRITGINYTL